MEQEQSSNQQTTTQSGGQKMPTGQKVLIVTGVILVLGTLSLIAFIMGKNASDNSSSTTPTPTAFQAPFPTATPTPFIPKNTPTPQATSTTPTPSPTPIPKTITLDSIANLDGFRSSNGGGNDSVDIRAGRNSNLVTRGFITFDLSVLPTGANITKATLKLYQTRVVGSPYSVGGKLKVDHLTYGDSLDNDDYASSALLNSFATLTDNATVEWKEADVTTAVKNDSSNARSTSQFRIHFTTEVKGGDVTGDFVYFESAEDTEGTGNTPELVIEYN
jgi:hypothetical protein